MFAAFIIISVGIVLCDIVTDENFKNIKNVEEQIIMAYASEIYRLYNNYVDGLYESGYFQQTTNHEFHPKRKKIKYYQKSKK